MSEIRGILLHASKSGHEKQALADVDRLLAHHRCPYSLVLRGILIQLQDEDCPYPLQQAADDFLEALRIDSSYLPALEQLAHFYDAVEPNIEKAAEYAEAYLSSTTPICDEMRRIAASRQDPA